MTEVKVVRKGSPEFSEARDRYLALFRVDQPEESVIAGMIGQKTTLVEKLREIPMPFGCPDLELYVWNPDQSSDGKLHVAYFCGRLGCLCAPCREDMAGVYPDYCPSGDEEWFDEGDEERFEEEDQDDYW